MKGYVVTLFNLPESVAVANRCKESGEQFGVEVDLFPAIFKNISLEELEKEQIRLSTWDESYSDVGAVVGNFITQYRIWKTIVESNEPGIVLEHDAVFVDRIPNLKDKGDIINLGKPSYGNFIKKNKPGIYPMFSKPGGYIPGAHGCYLTPRGALELISIAKQKGAAPCDMFLNNKNFPNIKESYPWPIEALDSFSTIQKEKGCIAKHNYNKDYKIF